VCKPGTDSAACGIGGATCQQCATYQFCNTSKACEVTPTSKWAVTLHKIAVDPNQSYETFGDPPDLYMEFTSGTPAVEEKTKTVSDQHTALFNEQIGGVGKSYTAKDLMSAIQYVIKDSDITWHFKIQTCDTNFYSSELSLGEARITTCPSDPNNRYVQEVVFFFRNVP
jgi:hypothetical protein